MALRVIMMRELVVPVALLFLATASAALPPSKALEGQWENPKRTTLVSVSVCGKGPDYCAVVLKASAETQENARKGGTTHFIGTQILRVHPVGEGVFKGTAFDPETNMHVAATVRMMGPGIMEMKGCVMMGLFCERQRWTKVE